MGLEYCEECVDSLEEDRQELAELWALAGEVEFPRADARRAVSLLYRVSHARILNMLGPRVAAYYPTAKVYRGRLRQRRQLWWVNHATGGVSIRPVLVWFSGQPRPGKDGRLRLRGGSTHYVVDHDGTPWCLVMPDDGSWHCGQRNKDGVSVELVNACQLRPDGRGGFKWWSGGRYKLPYPPVELDEPFRGARFMQPYDERQLIALVKLQRLTLAGWGPDRFAAERFTSHTDWNSHKLDPGPLFPAAAVTAAALSSTPLSGIEWAAAFTQRAHPAWDDDTTVSDNELQQLFDDAAQADEEQGDNFDHGINPEAVMMGVQTKLTELGLYRFRVDGLYGPRTRDAVAMFQEEWNVRMPDDQLKVDGIPGPQTQKRLNKTHGRWV